MEDSTFNPGSQDPQEKKPQDQAGEGPESPRAGEKPPEGPQGPQPGRLERLKSIEGGKKKKTAKKKARGGRPPKETREAEAVKDRAEAEKAYTDFADSLITYGDKWCEDQGLTPLHPLQKVLIKGGLVGTCLKYNLNFDQYPEIQLLGGAGWAAMDKAKELRQVRAKKAAETKEEKPEQGGKEKRGIFG